MKFVILEKNLIEYRKDNIYGILFWNIIRETKG